MIWLVKIRAYLIAMAAAIGVAFYAYAQARRAGRNEAELKQANAAKRLQEKYDEIDRKTIDPAGAYERLGKLSERQDRR